MTTPRCPICEGLPRGPLCKTHRQELAKTIHGLKVGMHELKQVERREIRYTAHGGGAAHPAFAPTPIDISAADLYDQVEDTIQDVAGDIGLWGGKAPQLLAKLASRMGRLADAPNSGRDYRQLTNALHRVRLRTTPPQDRIIHGHCLNPECGADITGLPDDQMATCPACGSMWSVAAIRQARVEELKGRTITCTPKDAADWTQWQTGRKVNRKQVTMWIKRGKLPSVVKAEEPGKWRFDTSELIACA